MVDVLRNYDQQRRRERPGTILKVKSPQRNNSRVLNVRPRSDHVPQSKILLSRQMMLNDTQLNSSVAPFKAKPLTFSEAYTTRSRKRFLGYTCVKCAPTSHASLFDDVTKSLGIRNIFYVPQQNKNRSLIVRQFAHINYTLNCKYYKYSCPPIDILLNNRIKEGISKSTEEDSHPASYHEKRAVMCFNVLKASISSSFLRFASWFLIKVLRRLFTSIQVHDGQIKALKKTEASPKPVIYLPLHRSHLDYIIITLVLFLNDIPVPFIAAGDNLRIPIFRGILSHLGGFFIKRKLDNVPGKKDFVYRSILHSYIVETLKLGNSLEFFIEGGRSRTGKVCLPKAGLLSIVIDAYYDGDVEDAYIVPVSVNFEKLIEGNFVAEQVGQKKKKETFFGAISSIWSTFARNYGNVRVDFGQPFILSEYLESIQSTRPSSPPAAESIQPASGKNLLKSPSILSLYGTDVAKEERRQLINRVAQHIVFDASSFSSIMCTNAVAFLLMTRHREGVRKDLLIEDFAKLCEDLQLRKKNLGFTGENVDVIDYSLQLLGQDLAEVVPESKDLMQQAFIKPNVRLPSVIELNYYSAPLVTVYFTQSVVANAIRVCMKTDIVSLKGCKSEIKLLQDDLLDVSLCLCDIMQFEHIFHPPCKNLQMLILSIIEDFLVQELLLNDEYIGDNYDKRRATNLMQSICWEGDKYAEYWKSPQYTVNLGESCVEKMCFLQGIISPYLESYWLTAIQLYKLIQKEMEEGVFIKSVQKDILKRLDDGLLLYHESVSLESIKNALKLFEIWGVIEHHRQDDIKLLYLGKRYRNSDSISAVVSKLQAFRS